MNGAQSLVQTAVRAGVRLCFANPGTTEMPLVEALDAVSGMRAVLCLFEGVCSGAADGYARMSGRPALTLLHLGPGFANGIANLHNARRARSPKERARLRPSALPRRSTGRRSHARRTRRAPARRVRPCAAPGRNARPRSA